MSRGRRKLIVGLTGAAIIFSLPFIFIILDGGDKGGTFPATLGNSTLIRESSGTGLIDTLQTTGLLKDDIVDVQRGDYRDTYGRETTVFVIRYPDHDTAYRQLEALKAKAGATEVRIDPLTAPQVFYAADRDAARYYYVKKSALYIVELKGVEFQTLKWAVTEI